MEEGFPFHFSILSCLFTLISICLFLLDVVLDLWAVVSLYEEEQYVSMGVLIAVLLVSSILVQVFSWIWYKEYTLETSTDKLAKKILGPLHFLQLGVFLRCASLAELSICKILKMDRFQEGVAVLLKHDLSLLHLFETFFESIPQIVILIPIVVQEQEFIPVFKAASSFLAVALTVMSYHRHMRELVPKDKKMNWSSSAVFFLWNLLLIISRVVAVALFASVLPCYIAVHFSCLWMLMLLCVWRQNTDFMENAGGEWLYRATVGVIWYFSWFSVSNKNTIMNILYSIFIGADTALLLGLWFWKTSVESASRYPLNFNPHTLLLVLSVLYIVGLLLKLLYYWKFHPKRDERPQMKSPASFELNSNGLELLETDTSADAEPQQTGVHKRMKNMLDNFY